MGAWGIFEVRLWGSGSSRNTSRVPCWSLVGLDRYYTPNYEEPLNSVEPNKPGAIQVVVRGFRAVLPVAQFPPSCGGPGNHEQLGCDCNDPVILGDEQGKSET